MSHGNIAEISARLGPVDDTSTTWLVTFYANEELKVDVRVGDDIALAEDCAEVITVGQFFRSFKSSLAEVKAQDAVMPVSTLGWPGSPIPPFWRTGGLLAVAHCRRSLVSQ
jgi:hypothetical protein